ncbi:MAG: putative zinc-binding metallopeptidase [Pseudomonadales bacterium]|nr:putative zinc-binding metallopeptidase [Pseudomonadales bacterium]
MPAIHHSKTATRRRAPAHAWARLADDELLKLRFADLKLKVKDSPIAPRVRRLYRELDRRGVKFRPHVWFAEEWFSPDGVPGIAIPFYLAHPRLERLERRMMNEVEGGNANWSMRILRHEAGHAVDTAYRLRRRKLWREVFGPASLPYPTSYRARPGSKRYVQHLGEWYAQAHPCEDFAETFAVWLKPNSSWRSTYADWPAFHKLEFVDQLMSEVRTRRPVVTSRAEIDPLKSIEHTLAEHYRRKIARHSNYQRTNVDRVLERIFTFEPTRHDAVRAAKFLHVERAALVSATVDELDTDPYTVRQMLRIAIDRCATMRLYVHGSRRDALRHARWMLVRITRLYSERESPRLAV